MRISDVARLAGVSARTIRHYHRLGILPEPARTAGDYRDYEIADLVRVMHIHYLSTAGVPLRSVPRFLENGAEGSEVTAEISVLSEAIAERIEQLERQRERLAALAERAASGQTIEPLPAEIRHTLDMCIAEVDGDAGLVRYLERERELFELLAISAPGSFPESLVTTYRRIGRDPQARASYLDLIARYRELENRPPSAVRVKIDALVEELCRDETLRELIVGESVDDVGDAGPSAADLVPDPAQREVIERVLDRLSGEGR
ncbi:MAG TPA: MerR family transcriptional regulator [Dietzia timorensis]|uniref:MerR family transcriptional regulator n=1 Tax=Dietzia timorensis TaxID=499555 RepID=A0A921JXN7_9ACTN|nr:MerR family transcriptional regulator [Dietzia timorensis]HJE90349.1 MerR family transcriptional regulator [Dietzia timorensis]